MTRVDKTQAREYQWQSEDRWSGSECGWTNESDRAKRKLKEWMMQEGVLSEVVPEEPKGATSVGITVMVISHLPPVEERTECSCKGDLGGVPPFWTIM